MPDSVQDIIRAEATKQGVPPALALAVAEQESGFNPTLFGPEIEVGGKKVKAIGTFQLLPDTAASLKVDPMDPRQNISGGVRYLRTLLDQHQGDMNAVLSTYGGVVHDTQYVPGVLERVKRFQALEGATTAATASAAARAGVTGAPKPGGTTPAPAAPGAPTASPANQPASFWDVEKMYLSDFFSALDPRSAEGRRNILSLGAETGASMLLGPRAGTAARTLVPAAAAGVAGGAETAAENALGTGTGDDAVGAGLMQGAYSLGGATLLWPIRRLGRSFIGGSVGEAAKNAVNTAVTDARAARTTAIAEARAAAQAGVDAAKDFAGAAIRDLKQRTAASLADVELENAVGMQAAQSAMNRLVPSSAGVASQMREVFEGPTKMALDKAGETVAAAAAKGPPIKLTQVQAALEAMVNRAKPASLFPAAADGVPAGVGQMANVAANTGSKSAAGVMATPAKVSVEDFRKMLYQQEASPSEARIPLSQILDQVRGLGDAELSFADAHALKRLLDERVTWDRPARAINEQLTKGVRQALRQTLEVHEPYNVATKAYAQLVNLYRRGVGKKLANAFKNDPDSAARILDPKSPSSALALKTLLIDQAGAGGGLPGIVEGQAAWDGARSMFTHAKLLKGDPLKLTERVTKLRAESPAFFDIVYGDPAGSEIIGNIAKIGAAIDQAQAQGAFRAAVVKEAGEDALQSARRAGVEAVRTARDVGTVDVAHATEQANAAVAKSVAERAKFKKSSMGKQATAEQTLGDVLHVAGGGLRTGWAVRSLLRLISAPSSAELLQWAAYSPARTQQMVRLLTSPIPDRAAAGFLRAAVAAIGDTDPSPHPASK